MWFLASFRLRIPLFNFKDRDICYRLSKVLFLSIQFTMQSLALTKQFLVLKCLCSVFFFFLIIYRSVHESECSDVPVAHGDIVKMMITSLWFPRFAFNSLDESLKWLKKTPVRLVLKLIISIMFDSPLFRYDDHEGTSSDFFKTAAFLHACLN